MYKSVQISNSRRSDDIVLVSQRSYPEWNEEVIQWCLFLLYSLCVFSGRNTRRKVSPTPNYTCIDHKNRLTPWPGRFWKFSIVFPWFRKSCRQPDLKSVPNRAHVARVESKNGNFFIFNIIIIIRLATASVLEKVSSRRTPGLRISRTSLPKRLLY